MSLPGHLNYHARTTMRYAFLRVLRRPVESSAIMESVPDEFVAARAVTPRERQMILLIAQGLANKEIGARLGISETTVRYRLPIL